MKYRLAFIAAIAAVAACSLTVGAADGGLPAQVPAGLGINIKPLWSAALMADTQTRQCEWIDSLAGRLMESRPQMLIHIGDTHFEWANRCAFRAIVDMLRTEPGGLEFHLAPGNHDMRNGVLKFHLRLAATEGIYGLDDGFTYRAEGYNYQAEPHFMGGPQWPVWNPEVANHPGWQLYVQGKMPNWGAPVAPCRYVFKRGAIRFIVCDWSYNDDQRDWLRRIITQPDDSSVTIVLHHSHNVGKLARYFDGLEGQHNVKLVLSGHDHRYYHEKRDGITYITSAGIAHGPGRDCDAMTLWVYKDYLRLDRYVIPKGASPQDVQGPQPIWMCEGSFGDYQRPPLPKRMPAYVRDLGIEHGVYYERSK